MEQRRLRAYFGLSSRRAVLVIAVGVLLLLLLIALAPGTSGYQEIHRRVFAVFAEELRVKASHLEVMFVLGYLFALVFTPVALIIVGLRMFSLQRQEQDFTDIQADALLSLRLGQLPAALEARLGLPGMATGDELLVLWAPRTEDRARLHPLDRKERKKLAQVPGKITVGRDGLVRCARLDVLVLEKRAGALYILTGFYDLIHQQLSGETWGTYRVDQALEVKEDPDHGRVALVMKDGAQFVVSLLTGKEGERLSGLEIFPLILFGQAGSLLRQFCEIQPPAAII